MAVGQIIGKVAVKVIPHTGDFRKEAQRDLSRIEKSLHIQAKVHIDPNQMKAEALKAVRDVNRVLRSNSAYRVKFHATIARSTMAEEIRKAQRALEDKARSNKIKFDTDVAAAVISGSLDKESMKVVTQELKDWQDENSPLKIMVRPEILTGAPAAVSARLALLTRPRTVTIVPVVSETAAAKAGALIAALAGGRALYDIFDNLWSSLKRLDKSIPTIGSVAFAILGLGGYALAAAGNLFALSQSLAQIGPAGLALPGILGGIAIGLGATFAVLKDFNDYLPGVKRRFQELQDAMSVNFWEVAEVPMRRFINTLFPQFSAGLQQTSTELGGFFANLSGALSGQFNGALAGMFDDLSESIRIAGGYTEAFATIIRVLGEVGAGYLPRLAEWFGSISQRFADFLSRTQEDGSLVGWIDRGIFMLQELGRAVSGLGSILSGLARAAEAAGGSTLSMFADTLERVANVVNGPVFQTQLTGVLTAAYDAMSRISEQAGPAVEDFFLNFSKTLQMVLPMVGSTLGALGEALFSALADPAVQTAFVGMIQGISTGFSALVPAIGALAPAFATIMDVIGAMASNLGPVLAAAFSGIAPVVTTVGAALIPLINTLGPILTQTLTALAPVMQFIGERLAAIAVAAQPLIQRIGELIQLVMPVLIPALMLLGSIISNAIIGVISGAILVFDGIKSAVQGFVSIFQGIVSIFQGNISQGFSQIWEGIKGIFTGALKAIWGLVKIWLNSTILGVFRGGIGKLLSFWKGGWNSLKGAAVAVWNAIKSALTAGLNSLRSSWGAIWNGIKNVFSGVWNAMKALVSTVWNAIRGNVSGAISGVRGIISGAMQAIRGLWSVAWAGIKAVLTTAWNGIKSITQSSIQGVINFVKGIPGKAKAALAGAGSTLIEAGRAIIQGLLDGIESMIGKVTGKLKALTDKIPDWKGPRDKDAKLLYEAGRLIMDGLVKGLESKFDDVKKALGGLTKQIPESASKGLAKKIKSDQANLQKLLGDYDLATKSLEARQQALNDVLNERNNLMDDIRSTVINSADIGSMGGGTEEITFAGIIENMKAARNEARRFNTVIQELVKNGLNDASVKQLVAAGPEAALTAAEAILAQGKAGVNSVNALQVDLQNAADALANTVKTDIFGQEVNIAQALVNDLTAGKGKIVDAMKDIVQAMMKAIDREFAKGKKDDGKKGDGKKGKKGKKRVATGQRARLSPSTLAALNDSLDAGDGAVVEQKVLNYYAAEGRSLTAEEDLFEAADRGRMVGW